MIEPTPDETLNAASDDQVLVDEIVRRGPGGALAVAGTAALIVLALWIAFYALVFVPRS